jgi:hypothetical protein
MFSFAVFGALASLCLVYCFLHARVIRDMSRGRRHPLPLWRPSGETTYRYLLDHAILDFSGDLTLDMVRDFLREDDSSEARALLGKLVEDRGVDDMIVTLADCLQDYLRTGLSDDVVREQLRLYSES